MTEENLTTTTLVLRRLDQNPPGGYVRDSPVNCFESTRKEFSYLHTFRYVGLRLDPGNFVLYLAYVILAVRCGICNEVAVVHFCADCSQQPLRQHWTDSVSSLELVRTALVQMQSKYESLSWSRAFTTTTCNMAGDIWECIDGLCHPFHRASRSFRSTFDLTESQFQTSRDLIEQYVQKVSVLLYSAWTVGDPFKGLYHRVQQASSEVKCRECIPQSCCGCALRHSDVHVVQSKHSSAAVPSDSVNKSSSEPSAQSSAQAASSSSAAQAQHVDIASSDGSVNFHAESSKQSLQAMPVICSDDSKVPMSVSPIFQEQPSKPNVPEKCDAETMTDAWAGASSTSTSASVHVESDAQMPSSQTVMKLHR